MEQSKGQPGEKEIQYLRAALETVEQGLSIKSGDEACLRLKSKLLKRLAPDDMKTYYEVLVKWKAAASAPNAWLLYELGRTSFILEYYDLSRKYFKELETGVGIGNKLRSRPRDPVRNSDGKVREFEGTVLGLVSIYDGAIRCDSLRSLRHTIAFRPIAAKFTPAIGDSVRFQIEFSYRGPRAENVRKT